MTDPGDNPKAPKSIDPGVATVVAALLALVGVIVTALVGLAPMLFGEKPASPAALPAETATVEPSPTTISTATVDLEQAATPSVAPPEPTLTMAITDVAFTATPAPTATALMTPSPMPQVVSALPPSQAEVVKRSSGAILDISQALPLLVRDSFDTNDYAWLEASETYQGGIACDFSIADGTYKMLIQTGDGAAWCASPLKRETANFALSSDLQLDNALNAEIYVNYRISPDAQSHYTVSFNPLTQSFAVFVVEAGEYQQIIPATYAEEIQKEGANSIALVVIGPIHTLYFGETLVAVFTDDRLTEGNVGFTVQLLEPNAEETLIVDNFELRGD